MNRIRTIIHAPHLTRLPGGTAAPLRAPSAAPPKRPIGPPLPPEPTPIELATNFAGAMARWAAAGFPTVTEATYQARSVQCEGAGGHPACQFWDPTGWLGLGKCKAPKCGCTRFKRWLATERCRHPAGSRWPNLSEKEV